MFVPLALGFNSIKVRLERKEGKSSIDSLVMFQFHKGTIRTHYNLEVGNLRINE